MSLDKVISSESLMKILSRSSASKNHAWFYKLQILQILRSFAYYSIKQLWPANQPTNQLSHPPEKLESPTKRWCLFKKAPGSMIARTSIWWCLGGDNAPGSRLEQVFGVPRCRPVCNTI